MFNVRETSALLQIEIASELRYIEKVIREAVFFLEKNGCASFVDLNIIMRELLCNAIEHGNLNIAERRISFTLEMTAGSHCRITVEDEGEGFAHTLRETSSHAPRGGRCRGLVLIRELAEHLEFNARGNRVSTLVRIPESEDLRGRHDSPVEPGVAADNEHSQSSAVEKNRR